VLSKAGRRLSPPAVVSPLMLPLMTSAEIRWLRKRCSSKATHPVPRAIPYSADRLSPTTRMRAGVAPVREAGV